MPSASAVAGPPFYAALERDLRQAGFDAFVDSLCAPLYAASMGRLSIPPGIYFRWLFVGCFESISSERSIAWRVSDSLSLCTFLGIPLEQQTPDHSTLSRTRARLSQPEKSSASVYDLPLPSEAARYKISRCGPSNAPLGRLTDRAERK